VSDTGKPSPDTSFLRTQEGVREIWDLFRAGGSAHCPADGAPMALAVDAFAAAYRFVCPTCGLASSWFECGRHGLQVMDHGTTAFGTRMPRP
jgi:hypothetical protein